MKRLLFLSIIGAAVISCTAKKGTTATTTEASKYDVDKTDVKRLEPSYPGVTLAELKEGKSLFETNCKLCHELEKSYGVAEEELKKIVPGMVKGVNKKTGGETLDETQKDKILHYLIAINTK